MFEPMASSIQRAFTNGVDSSVMTKSVPMYWQWSMIYITSQAAITHKGQWTHDGTDEMVDKHGDAKKHVEMKEH